MSKKRNATTVSDASNARDEVTDEQVVTDDDLVTEPEAEPTAACEKCTADVVDGVCVNCGTEA